VWQWGKGGCHRWGKTWVGHGRMNSPLARYASANHEPDPAAARRAAKAAWHEHGLILINPTWLPGWADRRQAELLAEKLHGKRKAI